MSQFSDKLKNNESIWGAFWATALLWVWWNSSLTLTYFTSIRWEARLIAPCTTYLPWASSMHALLLSSLRVKSSCAYMTVHCLKQDTTGQQLWAFWWTVRTLALQATRLRSGEAIFLDKQSYKVDISPGYDHAFVLCLIVIMDHYFHQDQAVIAWVDLGSSSCIQGATWLFFLSRNVGTAIFDSLPGCQQATAMFFLLYLLQPVLMQIVTKYIST